MKSKFIIKSCFIFIIVLLSNIFYVLYNSAQTVIYVSGNLSSNTTWSADTVKITGDITSDPGVTLTIVAGTYVEFHGHYSLDIDTLIAIGTCSDTIVFTMNDTTGFYDISIPNGGWNGIKIISAEMDYCRIEYTKFLAGTPSLENGTIRFSGEYSKLKISNSEFTNNRAFNGFIILKNSGPINIIKSKIVNNFCAGITLIPGGALIMDSCTIENNDGFGINLTDRTSINMYNSLIKDNSGTGIIIPSEMIQFHIENNTIDGNHRGIYLSNFCYTGNLINNKIINNSPGGGIDIWMPMGGAILINNLIANNINSESPYKGGGLTIMDSSFDRVKLYNNTIVNNSSVNGGGIYFLDSSIEMYNTILWGNSATTGNQIYCYSEGGFVTQLNGTYEYNDIEGGLTLIECTGVNGTYSNNLDVDPIFIDPGNDFRLDESSTCINKGTPDTTGLNLPENDLAGNDRICFERIDIGVYEYYNSIGVCGELAYNTVWDEDTIIVLCDIVCTKLTINPGTVIEFYGHYSLDIDTLIAIGTESDTIVFTMNDTTEFYDNSIPNGGWNGIKVISAEMNYCRIEYAKLLAGTPSLENGIIGFSGEYSGLKLKISNSELTNNRTYDGVIIFAHSGSINIIKSIIASNFCGGIKLLQGATLIMDSCTIENNNGFGIYLTNATLMNMYNSSIKNNSGIGIRTGTSPEEISIHLENNTIDGNHTGIYLSNEFHTGNFINNKIINNLKGGGIDIYIATHGATLINNLIANNVNSESSYKGGGLTVSYSDVKLYNNTIVNNFSINGGGIYFFEGSTEMYNTILWGNSASIGDQIYCFSDGEIVEELNGTYKYNNIEGGLTSIECTGVNGTYSDNLDEDPIFIDPGNNFQLNTTSPCIDAGMQDITGLDLPVYDLAGNSRVYNSRIDIGAYENNISVSNYLINTSHENILIYPNPVSNNIEIKILSEELLESVIEIYSMIGVKLYTNIFNRYQLSIDLSDYASSVYLFRFIDSHGKCLGEYFIVKK